MGQPISGFAVRFAHHKNRNNWTRLNPSFPWKLASFDDICYKRDIYCKIKKNIGCTYNDKIIRTTCINLCRTRRNTYPIILYDVNHFNEDTTLYWNNVGWQDEVIKGKLHWLILSYTVLNKRDHIKYKRKQFKLTSIKVFWHQF